MNKLDAIYNAATRTKIKKAAKSFKDFTGNNAQSIDKIKIKENNVAYELGKLVAVIYEADTADGKGSQYIHKFSKIRQPRLAVTNDGNQLLIVGGQFKVNSKRGIIG